MLIKPPESTIKHNNNQINNIPNNGNTKAQNLEEFQLQDHMHDRSELLIEHADLVVEEHVE